MPPLLKNAITNEHEELLWNSKLLSTDTSIGLIQAVIFYLIKCFGLWQGRDLKLLKTEHVTFGEDEIGKFVAIDIRKAVGSGRVIKRYDDQSNPRSVYKIMKTYKGYLANEGPFLVRPISSIKDYICYSPWPVGLTILEQTVVTIMQDCGLGPGFGNVSVCLMSIDILKSFGTGGHCISTWFSRLYPKYKKTFWAEAFRECSDMNCEDVNQEACLMISHLLDPPYPADKMLGEMKNQEVMSHRMKVMDARSGMFTSWISNLNSVEDTESADTINTVSQKSKANNKRKITTKPTEKEKPHCRAVKQLKHNLKQNISRDDTFAKPPTVLPSTSSSLPVLSDITVKTEIVTDCVSGDVIVNTPDMKIMTVLSIPESAFSAQVNEAECVAEGVVGGTTATSQTTQGRESDNTCTDNHITASCFKQELSHSEDVGVDYNLGFRHANECKQEIEDESDARENDSLTDGDHTEQAAVKESHNADVSLHAEVKEELQIEEDSSSDAAKIDSHAKTDCSGKRQDYSENIEGYTVEYQNTGSVVTRDGFQIFRVDLDKHVCPRLSEVGKLNVNASLSAGLDSQLPVEGDLELPSGTSEASQLVSKSLLPSLSNSSLSTSVLKPASVPPLSNSIKDRINILRKLLQQEGRPGDLGNFGSKTSANLGIKSADLGSKTLADLGSKSAELGNETSADLGSKTIDLESKTADLGNEISADLRSKTPANLGSKTPADLGSNTSADLGSKTLANHERRTSANLCNKKSNSEVSRDSVSCNIPWERKYADTRRTPIQEAEAGGHEATHTTQNGNIGSQYHSEKKTSVGKSHTDVNHIVSSAESKCTLSSNKLPNLGTFKNTACLSNSQTCTDIARLLNAANQQLGTILQAAGTSTNQDSNRSEHSFTSVHSRKLTEEESPGSSFQPCALTTNDNYQVTTNVLQSKSTCESTANSLPSCFSSKLSPSIDAVSTVCVSEIPKVQNDVSNKNAPSSHPGSVLEEPACSGTEAGDSLVMAALLSRPYKTRSVLKRKPARLKVPLLTRTHKGTFCCECKNKPYHKPKINLPLRTTSPHKQAYTVDKLCSDRSPNEIKSTDNHNTSARSYLQPFDSDMFPNPSSSLLTKATAESSSNSGFYYYRSDHHKNAAYQTVRINKQNRRSQTFTISDLPLDVPDSRCQEDSLDSPTSEICLGDYFPAGTVLPVKDVKLLTRQSSSGLEVVLKFEYRVSTLETQAGDRGSTHETQTDDKASTLGTQTCDRGSAHKTQTGTRVSTHETQTDDKASTLGTQTDDKASTLGTQTCDRGSTQETQTCDRGSTQETQTCDRGSTQETQTCDRGSTDETQTCDRVSTHETQTCDRVSTQETQIDG